MSGEYIRPPDMTNVHHTIRYSNRFFPYFQGCVGAIDGTHVSACVGGARADKFRGRKGDTTWNVMAACDFDLKFTYMLSGWEGSAHDARVLEHAISEPQNSFPFPPPEDIFHFPSVLSTDKIQRKSEPSNFWKFPLEILNTWNKKA
ncbi:hypothetical protein UlMin_025107 [Ulmus minor]